LQTAGYGAYQRIQTQTASPAELIALLYGGLQNDLQRAERGLQAGDYALVNERLTRAQAIVLELLASLDHSQGELPQQLSALYEYLYQRLVHANVHKDMDAVREAAQIVQPIAEAWSHIARPADGASG
jgi:flagellar protein FliS